MFCGQTPRSTTTMPDHDRAVALASALQARLDDVRFPLNNTTERELHDSVFAYADALKGFDLPVERVIVSVKRLANNAGIYASRNVPTRAALAGRDKLIVDLVGWCIERYYERPRADR